MAGSGTSQGFDAAAFRTAIQSAMAMGAPNDPTLQVTFVVLDDPTYASEDPATAPYDWTASPTHDVPSTSLVTVNAAVQWSLGTMADTPVGEFDTSHAVITMLDVDYAKISVNNELAVDEVLIGGNHYVIDFVGPPLGLFEVTVFQIHVTARG